MGNTPRLRLGDRVIPKKFHWLWFGPQKLPMEYVGYIREWLALHPDWEGHIWQPPFIGEIRNQDVYDSIHFGRVQPFSMAGHPPEIASAVQLADIVGYELIWKYGGVYLNCDIKPIKNIESLIDGKRAFCAKEDDAHLVNMAMGCVPGHEFFNAVIERLPSRVMELQGMPFEHQTGAKLLTEVYGWGNWDLDVHSPEIWNPVHFSQVPSGGSGVNGFDANAHPESYAVHGWGHRLVT